MSFQIPKTFYGAGFAVSLALFVVSYMADVEPVYRTTGIVLAVILFFSIIGVYVWDKAKYYYDKSYRP